MKTHGTFRDMAGGENEEEDGIIGWRELDPEEKACIVGKMRGIQSAAADLLRWIPCLVIVLIMLFMSRENCSYCRQSMYCFYRDIQA
jgi:hypothetical protein